MMSSLPEWLPRAGLAARVAGLVGVLAFALAALGCEGPGARTALSYSEDAKRAYLEAMEEFKAHNWIEAQSLFRDVRKRFAYSKYARLAELRIADADYEQDKFAEAIRNFRQFVHDHRANLEEVEYARWRIAEAQYQEISDAILLPPSEERDQATVLSAYREVRSFVHDYPDSNRSPRMCELLDEVTARLVRHELSVASFYLARDNYVAAVNRSQFALREYASHPPCVSHGTGRAFSDEVAGRKLKTEHHVSSGVRDYGLAPDALLLMGETYLKMHRWTDARKAFLAIITRYEESAIVVQANRYLAFMRENGV